GAYDRALSHLRRGGSDGGEPRRSARRDRDRGDRCAGRQTRLQEGASQVRQRQEGVTMRNGATALADREGETLIEVKLPGRSYDIVIGENLLASSGRRIAAVLDGARAAVVSDANVAKLHLPALKASLSEQKLLLGEAVVEPGEASKSFPVLASL